MPGLKRGEYYSGSSITRLICAEIPSQSIRRMWINIWLSAQSLANQTGRRPFLLSEGTIDDCSDWHLSPYKVHGDIILVAQLTLRRLLKELQELVTRLTRNFHHSSLHTGEIKYCLHRIQWEVDQWQITWARSEPTSPRSAKLKRECHCVRFLCML
jgi:hypothetical protein